MKLLPANVGAEPKKLAYLGALLVVLVIVYLMNRTPDSGAPSSAGSATPSSSPVPLRRPSTSAVALANREIDSVTPMPPQRRPQRGSETTIQDFKPSLKLPEGTDVSRIDPTLRLDEIAKLRTVALEGGTRSIFDFGPPPAPKEIPTVAPIKPGPIAPKPAAVAVTTPPAPAKPAAPPIPLKFYGYVDGAQGSSRRAFFLQGDDIFVAGENDVVGNRYKIARLTANAAVVEDTTTKNQQTLPIVEELP